MRISGIINITYSYCGKGQTCGFRTRAGILYLNKTSIIIILLTQSLQRGVHVVGLDLTRGVYDTWFKGS